VLKHKINVGIENIYVYFFVVISKKTNMDSPFIFQEKVIQSLSNQEYDYYLSKAWRNFGINFFRYSINLLNGKIVMVVPLRISLEKFIYAKSQKKIFQKCSRFEVHIQPIIIDRGKETLFEKHKLRFNDNIPDSLYTFLSPSPAYVPCTALEINVLDKGKLIATSFIGVGTKSASSIYAMFDTDYEEYSLGIYTLLLEIEYCRKNDFDYLYLGYAYDVPSFYDYKKRFYGLESYVWDKDWENFKRLKI
jgi:arginine-tRNA-protein transferase